ncbi:MAG: rhomboid family intramembrane serine protease [Anaerolineae bacterium]
MSYESVPREYPPYPQPEPAPAPPTSLPLPSHTPLWTYILLGINVLVFLAMTLLGSSESPDTLIRFGAKFAPLIIQGEYWRLMTANFIHIGVLHLALNSYALYLFGPQVERRFGRARFIVLYLLSGLGGAVLSYIGSSSLSAGASGAIFGLIGAITVYYATYREAFGSQGRRQLSSLLLVMGYNLLWGLMNPQIDNLGHVGGLVTGLALGWAFCPRYSLDRGDGGGLQLQDRFPRRRAYAASFAMSLLLIGLSALGTWIHTRGNL